MSKIIKFILFLTSSLLFTPAFSQNIKVDKTGSFFKELEEVSGMVFIAKDSFLVINDSGNDPIIYLVNEKAEIIKKTKVINAKNIDWEDLAMDKNKTLYIGDFGNNSNKRKKLYIHKVALNDVLNLDEVKVSTIQFNYPEQTSFPPDKNKKYYDTEALWVTDEALYILTKNRTEPSDGIAYFYKLPKKPGVYQAEKIGEYFTCDNNQIKCWITAADYHEPTKTIAVLTTKEIHILNMDKKSLTTKAVYTIPGIKQRESICFGENEKELFIADEFHKILRGGNIYKITIE